MYYMGRPDTLANFNVDYDEENFLMRPIGQLGYRMGDNLRQQALKLYDHGYKNKNTFLKDAGLKGLQIGGWLRDNRHIAGSAAIGLGGLGLAGTGYGAYRMYEGIRNRMNKNNQT